MSAFFAILLGSFLGSATSPDVIVLAGLAGFRCRAWWQVILAAVAIAVVHELVMSQIRMVYYFRPLSFVGATLAAAAWAFVVFWFVQRRRRQSEPAG